MRLKRELFAALLCLTISACVYSPRYPDLYNSNVSLMNGETVTEISKEETLNSLRIGQAAWGEKQPNHYSFIITYSTYFICSFHCGPNEVEVKDGEVVKVTYKGKRRGDYSNGSVVPKKDWNDFSIESHFERAESFLKGPKDLLGDNWGDERFWFLIDYDAEYGYPKLIARNDPVDNHGQHVTRIAYFKVIE